MKKASKQAKFFAFSCLVIFFLFLGYLSAEPQQKQVQKVQNTRVILKGAEVNISYFGDIFGLEPCWLRVAPDRQFPFTG